MKNEVNLIVALSNHLTDIQISELTREQIASFTEENITHLTPRQITLFSPEQISFFSIEQISFFSKKQISGKKYVGNYWTPEILDKEVGISSNSGGLSPEQIIALGDKVLSLGTIAITNLSPEATQALSPKYISLFAAGQIRGINVSVLSIDQISAISAKGIIGLTNTQLANLGKLISELSQNAVAALTTTQITGLSPFQTSKLTIVQLKSLNYTQITVLSKQQVSAFSSAQIQALFKEAKQYSFIFLLLHLKFDFVKSTKEKQFKENEKIRTRLSNLGVKLTSSEQHIFTANHNQSSGKQNKDIKKETAIDHSLDDHQNVIKKITSERLHNTNAAAFNLQHQIIQQGTMSKNHSNSLIDEINTITRMFVQLLMLYMPFKKEQSTEDISKKPSLITIIFAKINLDNLLNSNLRLESLILASDIVQKSSHTSYFNNIQITAVMRSVSDISNIYQTQFGHSTATLNTITESNVFKRNAILSNLIEISTLTIIKSLGIKTLSYNFLSLSEKRHPPEGNTILTFSDTENELSIDSLSETPLEKNLGDLLRLSPIQYFLPPVAHQDPSEDPFRIINKTEETPPLPKLFYEEPILIPESVNKAPIKNIPLSKNNDTSSSINIDPDTLPNLTQDIFNFDTTEDTPSGEISLNYDEPLATETTGKESGHPIQLLINNMASLNDDSANKTNATASLLDIIIIKNNLL